MRDLLATTATASLLLLVAVHQTAIASTKISPLHSQSMQTSDPVILMSYQELRRHAPGLTVSLEWAYSLSAISNGLASVQSQIAKNQAAFIGDALDDYLVWRRSFNPAVFYALPKHDQIASGEGRILWESALATLITSVNLEASQASTLSNALNEMLSFLLYSESPLLNGTLTAMIRHQIAPTQDNIEDLIDLLEVGGDDQGRLLEADSVLARKLISKHVIEVVVIPCARLLIRDPEH